MMSNVAQFSSRLTTCRTIAKYTAVLREFFYLLHNADRLYLCLDAAWSSKDFEVEEYLCCSIKAEQITGIPVRYGKTEIPVPFAEEHSSPSIFYISPICFQTRLFGYTMLKYNYPTSYDFSFRDWSKTVTDTLEFLRMKNDIHYLTQCQRETPLYDSLTGFYNLREFTQIAEESENCSMYAVKLNFATYGEFLYGENYRSDIISAAARAIKQACINHEICCRAYEDVFLMLCKGEGSIFAERMRVMLHEAMSSYDEHQVLISYVETAECTVNKLCTAAAE